MPARRARTDLRRRAADLLDQQLWCWGRDVARPQGNVLLGLGMCRYRSAEPGPDRTAYTGRVAGDGVVWLWGFGLLFCLPERGGVFLRRNRFEPLLVERPPERPVHRPEDVGPCLRPVAARHKATAGELVRAVAAWAAGYEHWVAETFGRAYRESTLAARGRAPAIWAGDMAGAWEHLAKKSFRLNGPDEPKVGPWCGLLGRLRAGVGPAGSSYRPPARVRN